MQYNVAQLLREPTGSTRSFTIESEPVGKAEFPNGKVRMVRTHRGILLNADVDIEAKLTCSRCLSNFLRPSSFHIEEEFLSAADLQAERLIDPDSHDEPAFSVDDENILDLSEAIRQYTISDHPMKPLCQDKCFGLCQTCGMDLNQGECECESGTMDPRWGALAGLLGQGSG